MYTITRKNRIREQLQLCHANGDVALVAEVDLNVDKLAGQVNKAYEVLGMVQNVLQKEPNSEQAQKAYGEAIIALFGIIFGEETTEKIVTFYENNWSEMLLDLFPFINDEIIPQIREASAERTAQLKAAARASKRARR